MRFFKELIAKLKPKLRCQGTYRDHCTHFEEMVFKPTGTCKKAKGLRLYVCCRCKEAFEFEEDNDF